MDAKTIEQEITRLMKEIAGAKALLDEMEREHREKERSFILGLIEVCDAFERVFAHALRGNIAATKEGNALLDSFRMIYELLENELSLQGVTAMEDVSGAFSPLLHKAAGTKHDSKLPEGTIIEIVKRGYVWGDGPIRKPEVMVSSRKLDT